MCAREHVCGDYRMSRGGVCFATFLQGAGGNFVVGMLCDVSVSWNTHVSCAVRATCADEIEKLRETGPSLVVTVLCGDDLAVAYPVRGFGLCPRRRRGLHGLLQTQTLRQGRKLAATAAAGRRRRLQRRWYCRKFTSVSPSEVGRARESRVRGGAASRASLAALRGARVAWAVGAWPVGAWGARRGVRGRRRGRTHLPLATEEKRVCWTTSYAREAASATAPC